MNRISFFVTIMVWYLLKANTTLAYSRQDTLRGTNGSGRNWWDVTKYELNISFDTATQSIHGYVDMKFKLVQHAGDSMQLDLQEPMVMDSIMSSVGKLLFVREGNVLWVNTPSKAWQNESVQQLRLYYHGSPRKAKMPPWDGGFIWAHDSTGKPWIAVACQGLGASVWWPCKDYQGDEPDSGARMTFDMGQMQEMVVSNGRELATPVHENTASSNIWAWEVQNPINTYDITFYIGDYISWQDTMMGEKGKLDLSFYTLRYNEAKARKQFAVVKQMLHCFEYWMGPYPFYEDGYKLVEAPYLGMEHQSAVAYGNQYKMGYLGDDRSHTGVGTLFDFIIVHESGHEWFGNNITAADIADNWIHEGITTYSEALFAECAFGKEKAFAYTTGEWKNIRNDRNIIGDYGVQDEGSGDKYDKGSALIHTIRLLMNNDEQFRQLLRGLNREFYHSLITSAEIENYIIKHTGLKLDPIFNQYLRTSDIPQLEYYIKDKQLYFRFNNVVAGFSLPLHAVSGNRDISINPTNEWQSVSWKGHRYNVDFPQNFLFTVKQ